MKHRAPAWYYDRLLGKEGPKKKKLMLVDVANPDEEVVLRSGPHGLGRGAPRAPKPKPLLALADRVEGDPEEGEEEEDGEDGDAGQGQEEEKQEQGAVNDFAPFTFVRTGRKITAGPRAGQVQLAWQAQCPFHRDQGDHPQTFCRRAITFSDASEEADVILNLKLWCILGRACGSRAIRPHGHKFVSLVGRPNPGEARLKERLREGLAAKHWIMHELVELDDVEEAPVAPQVNDSSSSSDDS